MSHIEEMQREKLRLSQENEQLRARIERDAEEFAKLAAYVEKLKGRIVDMHLALQFEVNANIAVKKAEAVFLKGIAEDES